VNLRWFQQDPFHDDLLMLLRERENFGRSLRVKLEKDAAQEEKNEDASGFKLGVEKEIEKKERDDGAGHGKKKSLSSLLDSMAGKDTGHECEQEWYEWPA